MVSSSGTVSSTTSTTRSAMAVVCSTSEPMGVLTETVTMPWSISGMSTILVDRQDTMNTATRATEASMPRARCRVKKASTLVYQSMRGRALRVCFF